MPTLPAAPGLLPDCATVPKREVRSPGLGHPDCKSPQCDIKIFLLSKPWPPLPAPPQPQTASRGDHASHGVSVAKQDRDEELPCRPPFFKWMLVKIQRGFVTPLTRFCRHMFKIQKAKSSSIQNKRKGIKLQMEE